MGAIAAILLSFLAGFSCLRACWPAPRRWSRLDPLRLAAAPALGIGIASGFFFALRVVLHQSPAITFAVFFVATLLLLAVAWWRAAAAAEDPAPIGGSAPFWLWVTGVITVAASALTFLLLQGAAPQGEWDAWAIWNLRARFLFRAQDFNSAFSALLPWSHPDYPLLIPGANAFFWNVNGAEAAWVPGLVAFCLLGSLIMVPFFLVRHLRGPALAILTPVAILAATTVVRTSASQYADVPVAAFVAIAGCLAVLALELPAVGAGPLMLAGLAASFAAWTKNEGLLFCITLAAMYLFSLVRLSEAARRWKTLPWLILGMLPVLALVGHLKFRLVPPNDLVNAAATPSMAAHLADFNRYWVTFWGFMEGFLTFGNLYVPPAILFAIWFGLVRFRPRLTGALLLPTLLSLLQILGYFFVFVASSNNLDFQLETALGRVLLHVWPLAVTGMFLISGELQPSTPAPKT